MPFQYALYLSIKQALVDTHGFQVRLKATVSQTVADQWAVMFTGPRCQAAATERMVKVLMLSMMDGHAKPISVLPIEPSQLDASPVLSTVDSHRTTS